jgi:hypothetical protein
LNPKQTEPGNRKIRWHVTLDLVYEAGADDSCEEGVRRVRNAIRPVFENGSGIQEIYFTRLPEKI